MEIILSSNREILLLILSKKRVGNDSILFARLELSCAGKDTTINMHATSMPIGCSLGHTVSLEFANNQTPELFIGKQPV